MGENSLNCIITLNVEEISSFLCTDKTNFVIFVKVEEKVYVFSSKEMYFLMVVLELGNLHFSMDRLPPPTLKGPKM
jgi:hypothetical protein